MNIPEDIFHPFPYISSTWGRNETRDSFMRNIKSIREDSVGVHRKIPPCPDASGYLSKFAGVSLSEKIYIDKLGNLVIIPGASFPDIAWSLSLILEDDFVSCLESLIHDSEIWVLCSGKGNRCLDINQVSKQMNISWRNVIAQYHYLNNMGRSSWEAESSGNSSFGGSSQGNFSQKSSSQKLLKEINFSSPKTNPIDGKQFYLPEDKSSILPFIFENGSIILPHGNSPLYLANFAYELLKYKDDSCHWDFLRSSFYFMFYIPQLSRKQRNILLSGEDMGGNFIKELRMEFYKFNEGYKELKAVITTQEEEKSGYWS